MYVFWIIGGQYKLWINQTGVPNQPVWDVSDHISVKEDTSLQR